MQNKERKKRNEKTSNTVLFTPPDFPCSPPHVYSSYHHGGSESTVVPTELTAVAAVAESVRMKLTALAAGPSVLDT